MVHTLRFFPLQNAVRFIILTYLLPVLFTFYVQGVLKLKKNNSGAKRLRNYKIQPYWALRTQTAGSVNVRVQNIFHGRNNITCSTDCKY